ncbi:hypothetical protein SUGI_0597770 [Cryptomeria japonica]|nr:hypothetical protein SUGI_0597770 [Cryptomeria japonica]
MGRKWKWKSLIQLDVQDIPNEENHFSSDNLEWTPIVNENVQDLDLCAAIPLERLSHFVKGEDGVTPSIDDDHEVGGSSSHENNILVLDNQESSRRHRLPFSIDLNQSAIDEMQIIDGTICGTQPSSTINVIPNQTFQQTILDDQQNSGQHRLPFRIDLNQAPGTMDAIEIEDGFDEIAMANHDQHYYK